VSALDAYFNCKFWLILMMEEAPDAILYYHKAAGYMVDNFSPVEQTQALVEFCQVVFNSEAY